MIIQPNFQACLRVEESSQEASKSGYKYLTWYCLTCTDAKRDVWEDPIMTESDRDDKPIERGIVGERPTTTGGGMYKVVF